MFDNFATAVLADYRTAECQATTAELRLVRDIQAGRGRRKEPSLRETVRDGIIALAQWNPLLAVRAHSERNQLRG